TGTTDEQRDAWFAGFTGDRLAVVWIGYDDNRAARLTGAASALPVWGELMASLGPEPLALPKPEGIEDGLIDTHARLQPDAGVPGSRGGAVQDGLRAWRGRAVRHRRGHRGRERQAGDQDLVAETVGTMK